MVADDVTKRVLARLEGKIAVHFRQAGQMGDYISFGGKGEEMLRAAADWLISVLAEITPRSGKYP